MNTGKTDGILILNPKTKLYYSPSWLECYGVIVASRLGDLLDRTNKTIMDLMLAGF